MRSKNTKGGVVEAARAPLPKGGRRGLRAVGMCPGAGGHRFGSVEEDHAVSAAFGAFAIRGVLASRVTVAADEVRGARVWAPPALAGTRVAGPGRGEICIVVVITYRARPAIRRGGWGGADGGERWRDRPPAASAAMLGEGEGTSAPDAGVRLAPARDPKPTAATAALGKELREDHATEGGEEGRRPSAGDHCGGALV